MTDARLPGVGYPEGPEPTWAEWHQAMKDGKEWAWAPTQVMSRLREAAAVMAAQSVEGQP